MRCRPADCLPALILLVGLKLSPPAVAQDEFVEALRIQKVGDVTYFHLRLKTPTDLVAGGFPTRRQAFFAPPMPSLDPRLVCADGRLSVVCQRLGNLSQRFGDPSEFLDLPTDPTPPDTPADLPADPGVRPVARPDVAVPRAPVPVQGLEFMGRCEGTGVVQAKLHYPVDGPRPLDGRQVNRPVPVWKEVAVTLDFKHAQAIATPREATARRKLNVPLQELPRYAPVLDDLEGLWALAQIEQFLGLDQEVNEFGFYQFAATAAARKYHVYSLRGASWGGNFARPSLFNQGGPTDMHQLFEMTTGAAAITESLQLRRMNAPRGFFDDQARRVPIAKVAGSDIQEHPWKKMIGEKKPAPEAMAKLVPHDNYYVHFKDFASFQELGELLDQWGTNLLRTYQANSRDHRLKQRYEQQLCLKSTILGKMLGPLVINGIAITGSDPFLREGTDVAVLFDVKSKRLFLASVDGFIAEARKKHGDELKEVQATYKNVAVESYTTPLREVSLYRASLGDVVVYANSFVGLQRIIDTHQGTLEPIGDSLDFQYMRTVFRYDDPDEDGFVFLSDAFIRRLVGPATKIKEERRLEALASLHMMTHGAMFTAWDQGVSPESLESLLSLCTLRPEELPMPEGPPANWHAGKLVAHSDVYNTLHFATPLIELPIDNVTDREAQGYDRFRQEYLGLWREYFDPIGMRFSLKENEVQVETYILPLIQSSAYNRLRDTTGDGTTLLAPAAIPTHTLAQYLQHVNLTKIITQQVNSRRFNGPGNDLPFSVMAAILNPLGKWFFIRINDGEAIDRLVQAIDKADQGEPIDNEEIARRAWQLPIVIGADVRNPVTLAAALATFRTNVLNSLPGGITWEASEEPYKEVTIVRVGATEAGRRMIGVPAKPGKPFLPAIYYAMVDGGIYLTLNEATLHSLIDTIAAQKQGTLNTVEVNSSLYFSPAAAVQTQAILQRLLERQVHQQARTSLSIWYALYRTKVVSKDATPVQAEELAYRFLGFVPVSPEGAAFRFDEAHDEVLNERHGSFRNPVQSAQLADKSPLQLLLKQVHSVRADLRFREDGIHTVLTLDRSKPAQKD